MNNVCNTIFFQFFELTATERQTSSELSEQELLRSVFLWHYVSLFLWFLVPNTLN